MLQNSADTDQEQSDLDLLCFQFWQVFCESRHDNSYFSWTVRETFLEYLMLTSDRFCREGMWSALFLLSNYQI